MSMRNDNVFIHIESGGYYAIKKQVQNEESETIDVYYERFGDGFGRKLSIMVFMIKFRNATLEEIEKLKQALPTLKTAGKAATLKTVEETLAGPPAGEGGEGGGVGILVEPTDDDTFERLVVSTEVITSVDAGLNRILKREEMEKVWGKAYKSRAILNFYGDPGTGKTMTAKCIAKKLGKKLYQVDYSQVISKWVGDTAKHIKSAFTEAAKHDAVLFFDEADSLLSKRMTNMEESFATSINQNRNTLMQELDKFQGVVIMTTNLFANYDEALLRRIAQHVKFELPTKEMREKLIAQYLPKSDRVQGLDIPALAEASDGFSGGDILNMCDNAVDRVSLEADSSKWILNQEAMLSEAKKIKDSKKQHKGGVKARKPMGMHVSLKG